MAQRREDVPYFVPNEASDEESDEECCNLRLPVYPPGCVFGHAWLACTENNMFRFDAEKMLQVVEEILGTTNRSHSFFLDMKQALYLMWPVPEFEVQDSEYPDNVGARYPRSLTIEVDRDIQSKSEFFLLRLTPDLCECSLGKAMYKIWYKRIKRYHRPM